MHSCKPLRFQDHGSVHALVTIKCQDLYSVTANMFSTALGAACGLHSSGSGPHGTEGCAHKSYVCKYYLEVAAAACCSAVQISFWVILLAA